VFRFTRTPRGIQIFSKTAKHVFNKLIHLEEGKLDERGQNEKNDDATKDGHRNAHRLKSAGKKCPSDHAKSCEKKDDCKNVIKHSVVPPKLRKY